MLSASSTSARSSSGLRMVEPATTSVTPNGRRSHCADPCSTQTTGRSTTDISSTGRATSAASRSARSSVSAFGISSPSTTDRYVTTVKPNTKPTQCGTPSPSNRRIAGSPTAPVRIPSAVMPTWTVEITRTGSSISRSADAAPRLPASARAATADRRAVTTLYSPMTKKALPPTRASTTRMRRTSSMRATIGRAQRTPAAGFQTETQSICTLPCDEASTGRPSRLVSVWSTQCMGVLGTRVKDSPTLRPSR